MPVAGRGRRSSISKLRAAIESLESRQLLSGNTYYVSPSGSDSNSGSSTSPFLTLEHAAVVIANNLPAAQQPGCTVYAEPGTYAGFAFGLGTANPVSGTAANPITFEPAPGAAEGSVIINTIFGSGRVDAIRMENCSYVTVNGFTITNPSNTITQAGIHQDGCSFMIDTNNNISGMGMWGILTGFTSNSLFEDNICDNSQVQHGIYISNSCTNDSVVGNTCAGNYACGIHFNGDISEKGTGVTSNDLIEGNFIYDNGNPGGGSGIDCDGIQDSIIENNIIADEYGSGISLYTGDASGGSINDTIVGNTFTMATTGRYVININSVASSGPAIGSTGNVVEDNIIYDTVPGHGVIEIDSLSLPGFVSDYNVVTSVFSDNGGSSNLTLAQWQAATGQDMHSIVSPQAANLINPSSTTPAGYDLLGTAPAIGEGVAVTLPSPYLFNTDYLGNARPTVGKYDSGAFQFIPPSTISGSVFQDNNSDGTIDGTDTGTPFGSLTVYLDINNAGSFVTGDPTAVTFANGTYTFNNLSAGLTGTVRLESPPAGFVLDNGSSDGFTTSAGSSSTVNLAYFPTTYTPSGNYDLILSGSNINIEVGGSVVYIAPLSLLNSLTFNLVSGSGSLLVDETNGNPIPSGGITYDGGSGTDSLTLTIPKGNNNISVDATHVTANGSTITYATTKSIAINTGSGNDTLTQLAQPGNSATLNFMGGAGNDSLIVNGGTYTISTDPTTSGTTSLAVTVGASGALVFTGNNASTHGIRPYHLNSLTVNGTVTLSPSASGYASDETLLTTNTLVVNNKLDITSNSIDVHYLGNTTPFSTIRTEILGNAIYSSLANDGTHAVGYADGADGVVANLPAGDILIKYTLTGDANLDGTVNFSDLLLLSGNYTSTNATWDQGDFTGDGTVNFSDLLALSSNYTASLATGPAVTVSSPAITVATARHHKAKKH